jgi:hypothetical protein
MPVAPPRADNPLNPFAPHSQGNLVWSAGTIAQITSPTVIKTAKPLVSRFATDSESSTPGAYRTFVAKQSFNQFPPLLNERCVFPWHAQGKTQKLPEKLLPMS